MRIFVVADILVYSAFFICSAGNIKSDTNSYSSIFQQLNTLSKKSWFLKTKSNSFTHKHQLFFSKNQKNNNKLFFFSKRLLFFFFVGKLLIVTTPKKLYLLLPTMVIILLNEMTAIRIIQGR